ncbi:MAG: hypothetical protein J0J11_00260 [Microbacterium sp.]|nr:hypothetical protein [Microbacterium sp.]
MRDRRRRGEFGRRGCLDRRERVITRAMDAEVLAAAAAELLAKAERPRAVRTIVLDAAPLLSVPRAVLRAALRLVWEREGWPMADMTFAAWERAVEVAARGAPACDFPGGVTMRHAGRVVQIAQRK